MGCPHSYGMLSLFRQNRPLVLLMLPLLLALLWPGATPVEAPLALTASGMPAHMAFRQLLGSAAWTLPVLACLLVAGLAVQLNFTVNSSGLFEERNHVPALLLPLLLALYPLGLVPDPALAGMPFIIWALRRLWSSVGQQRPLGPLADAGLLIGLATCFHLPYAFMVVVIWSTLAITRPFHWREYFVPLLGLAAILFLLWGALYLFAPGVWAPLGSLRIVERPAGQHSPVPHWLRGVVMWVVAGILLVSAAVSFAAGYARGIMREKNIRASFLAFAFTCGLLAAFAWFTEGRVPPVLVAVPMAVLLAWPLSRARRVAWAEAAALALLALGVWGRWG